MRPDLLMFDGPTGAGKSTLLRYVKERYAPSIRVGAKFSTRQRRVGDNDWEFQFVDSIPERANKYAFSSVSSRYAIDVDQLRLCVEADATYCVTCVDRPVLEALRRDYRAVLAYVYRPLSMDHLEELLRSRGTSSTNDSLARRQEWADVVSDYKSKLHLYDHVILNTGGENDMFDQFDVLARLYGMRSASG